MTGMICPRCKCEIADDSKVCEFCGKNLEKKKFSSIFKNRKTDKKQNIPKPLENKPGADSGTIVKVIIALLVTALIFILAIIIIINLNKDNGLNYAKSLSEYINAPILSARNETDIYIADESAYDSVNQMIRFNYIVESEKDVEADGVTYPEWAVLIRLNDNDEIANVTYVDFTVMKKSYKGEKTNEEINLDKFEAGEKFRKVRAAVDLDPFTVSFNGSTITYNYCYYFKNNYNNEQAMSLSVVITESDEYCYSTSQKVFEPWII